MTTQWASRILLSPNTVWSYHEMRLEVNSPRFSTNPGCVQIPTCEVQIPTCGFHFTGTSRGVKLISEPASGRARNWSCDFRATNHETLDTRYRQTFRSFNQIGCRAEISVDALCVVSSPNRCGARREQLKGV